MKKYENSMTIMSKYEQVWTSINKYEKNIKSMKKYTDTAEHKENWHAWNGMRVRRPAQRINESFLAFRGESFEKYGRARASAWPFREESSEKYEKHSSRRKEYYGQVKK